MSHSSIWNMDKEEQLKRIKQFLADKYGDEFLEAICYEGFAYNRNTEKWEVVE